MVDSARVVTQGVRNQLLRFTIFVQQGAFLIPSQASALTGNTTERYVQRRELFSFLVLVIIRSLVFITAAKGERRRPRYIAGNGSSRHTSQVS